MGGFDELIAQISAAAPPLAEIEEVRQSGADPRTPTDQAPVALRSVATAAGAVVVGLIGRHLVIPGPIRSHRTLQLLDGRRRCRDTAIFKTAHGAGALRKGRGRIRGEIAPRTPHGRSGHPGIGGIGRVVMSR